MKREKLKHDVTTGNIGGDLDRGRQRMRGLLTASCHGTKGCDEARLTIVGSQASHGDDDDNQDRINRIWLLKRE